MKVNLKKVAKKTKESSDEICKELENIGGPQLSMNLREQWSEVFRQIKNYIQEKLRNEPDGSNPDDDNRGESLSEDNPGD